MTDPHPSIVDAHASGAHRSSPVEGFALAYERRGSGRAVVALHGWPGDRHDWRPVAEALTSDVDFIAPDLRGFGESDAHPHDPAQAYTPTAQAASILGLVDELALGPVILVGYDLGSLVAEQVARMRPEIVAGLVLAPPLPGLSRRLGEPRSLRERWYISFHQSRLAGDLLDGDRDAVRTYLAYFWSQWSAPGFQLADAELDRLADRYSAPGAFTASTAVYRSGRPSADETPLRIPATLLWPDSDPLFPTEWAADASTVLPDADLRILESTGHFAPREAPGPFTEAILRHRDRGREDEHEPSAGDREH